MMWKRSSTFSRLELHIGAVEAHLDTNGNCWHWRLGGVVPRYLGPSVVTRYLGPIAGVSLTQSLAEKEGMRAMASFLEAELALLKGAA